MTAEIINSNEEDGEDRSKLKFATAEERSNTTTPTAQLCATTNCKPDYNLSLVPLKQEYNYATEPDTDEIDSDSNIDSFYGMDLGETLEEWCKTEAEQCNFDSTSVPVANPPISRERLT